MGALESWGRFPRVAKDAQSVQPLSWETDRLAAPAPQGSLLPFGLGRSYGDSCLNPGGTLLTTFGLDRFIDFDPATGVLQCEAGVSFDAILRLVAPRGFFLPVTPGTKFVTVGGAIANDVHGKNHHASGTFGRYVRSFVLLRSDGQRLLCSPTENADLFAATIGGLGLTGVVLRAEVQLIRTHNVFVVQETVPFGNLGEFLAVNESSEKDFVYTVAWMDFLASGRKLGRGLYYRGNHAPPQLTPYPADRSHLTSASRLSVPFELPGFSLNRLTVAAFNFLYYWRQRLQPRVSLLHYDPFFYPLDGVLRWNRIYGRPGFLQFQCVVPLAPEGGAMKEILERISHSGQASFLGVLKTFGPLKSPGMLSFPRPGITLALDFANRGERTVKLFAELDRVTREAGGAIYPAKDSLMAPETFEACYPQLSRFKTFVDPAFSSLFWRRVTGTRSARSGV